MSYAIKIPFDYDQKEYYEFLWLYERLATQNIREQEQQNEGSGQTNLANHLVNPMQGVRNGRR